MDRSLRHRRPALPAEDPRGSGPWTAGSGCRREETAAEDTGAAPSLSDLAEPQEAARELVLDRRSSHREEEPRRRPPGKPHGHAGGPLRRRRG